MRGVFLNLSKVFNKVWHEGILNKFNSNGITGNDIQLIELLESFFHNRLQKVALKGQSSSWQSVRAGVPKKNTKKNKTTHWTLFFNNSEIKLSSNQKYLGQ